VTDAGGSSTFWDLSTLVLLAAGAVIVLLAAVIVHKGRPFAAANVFRASRLSSGNHFFPTQVVITPTSVVHYTPRWVGHLEHSIHMAHVASVAVQTRLLFSDVYIETTGGTTPIHCRGHRKKDAIEMKQLIERYQTAYYQQPPAAAPPTVAGQGPPGALQRSTRRDGSAG